MLFLRLRDFDSLLVLQYHLLTLLSQLRCTNYTRVVTLNLWVLFWLEKTQHPAFQALQKCPEAFSEEKGETSLSLLASLPFHPNLQLHHFQQKYTLLPYCRKITQAFSEWCHPHKPSLRKPLKTTSPAVLTLFSHFSSVLQKLSAGSWTHYPLQETTKKCYPPFSSVICCLPTTPTLLSTSLSLLVVTQQLKTLKQVYWTNNSWGDSVLSLLPERHAAHLNQQQTTWFLQTFPFLQVKPASSPSSSQASSQPSSSSASSSSFVEISNFEAEGQLYISLQPEFEFVAPNNIFNFYT